MSAESRSQHVEQALTYLQQSDLSTISVRDQALLLRVLVMHDQLTGIQQDLVSALQQRCASDWTQSANMTDVFAVLDALHYVDASFVTGSHLAAAVRRLVSAEQSPGGPYFDEQGELDFGTNAAIASFCEWAAGPLPNITQYLRRYLSSVPSASLQSQHIAQALLIPELRDMLSGAAPTIVTSLHEALHVLLASATPSPDSLSEFSTHDAHIMQQVRQDMQQLGESMAAQADAMLLRIARANKNYEITLLPSFFAQALLDHNIPPALLEALGQANLYCWMAYTLYDDIFDEQAHTELLPLANLALRRSIAWYKKLFTTPDCTDFCDAVFDAMDAANTWESIHARCTIKQGMINIRSLPDYEQGDILAARSFAHALGPIFLTTSIGHPLASPQNQAIQQAMRHYLIARQLTDDLHDWQEDIRAGSITFVVNAILHELAVAQGTYNIKQLLKRMQQQFRIHTVRHICTVIDEHLWAAHEQLSQSGIVSAQNPVTALLDALERSLKDTQKSGIDSTAFADSFDSHEAR
ncbi:MAG: hypothetical protein ACQR33_05305 [Candidatus Saccharibacteria bacterium]